MHFGNPSHIFQSKLCWKLLQAAAEIPYSFTVELPDSGIYGFLLPPSQIKTVGAELWAATGVVSLSLPYKHYNILHNKMSIQKSWNSFGVLMI